MFYQLLPIPKNEPFEGLGEKIKIHVFRVRVLAEIQKKRSCEWCCRGKRDAASPKFWICDTSLIATTIGSLLCRIDPCLSSRCNYGGSCSSNAGGFTCSCPYSSSTSVANTGCAGSFTNRYESPLTNILVP